MLEKPKAVFFDWDGTLVDSFRFLHAAHNHVRAILKIEPFSLEIFAGYFGQPREKLYKELYGDNIEEAKFHFEAYVRAHHLVGLRPMEGAEALLNILFELDIPCGIVSNKKGTLIEAEIDNFGWRKYFKSVVGAAEASADKPSAAPLFLALQKAGLNVQGRDVWFVGDTDNDMACARDAGSVSIFIAETHHYEKLKGDFVIDLHCENCTQLHDFLLQYKANGLKQD
jgi:phosphoglycolate phosphatase